ncbi:MAG: CocE/NonD family hydrolase [Deltaproteobacteria bacterium]|nr:CocE/NonD family hydrolase [Deltaproteobacteria bacterium]
MADRLIVLKGGKLIDGTGTEPIEDADVVIRGSKIEAVGAAGTVECPPEVQVLGVYPDGRAYNIHDGIIRTRYREGMLKNVRMTPGEVYEVTIDLQATANYFGPGHCIRLEISSSNFPRFERNLNTGGNNYDETEWIVAENTVYHSEKHPSHILLPISKG